MRELAPLKPRDAATVRSVTLFQRLPDRALSLLMASATVRTVPPGANLFLQDEPADRFFVMLDGWVKLYRLTRDGAEAVVNVVAPGETFAEAAMFANGAFPVCAQAVNEARVLAISAEGFARCLREDATIAFAMLGSLSTRLRHLVQQIEQLQVRSAPQRVGAFLLRFCPSGTGSATFDLPFDKSLVAKRLGMQPETFSRALAKLRAIGVTTHGGTVSIADLEGLRHFCLDDSEDTRP